MALFQSLRIETLSVAMSSSRAKYATMASPPSFRISPETLSGPFGLFFPIAAYFFPMILLYTGFALQHIGASFGCRTVYEVFQNFWLRRGELFMSRPGQFNPVKRPLDSIKHKEFIEHQKEMAHGFSKSS